MQSAKHYFATAILLLWSTVAVAALPDTFEDGWHTWKVDSNAEHIIYVRFSDGSPKNIRTTRGNCFGKPEGIIRDHGVVTADVNFQWFRDIVERSGLDHKVRNAALFGLAQSDSDAAYAYLDQIIMGR